MSSLATDARYEVPGSWGLLAARNGLPFVFAIGIGPRLGGPDIPAQADKGQFSRRNGHLIELKFRGGGGPTRTTCKNLLFF